MKPRFTQAWQHFPWHVVTKRTTSIDEETRKLNLECETALGTITLRVPLALISSFKLQDYGTNNFELALSRMLGKVFRRAYGELWRNYQRDRDLDLWSTEEGNRHFHGHDYSDVSKWTYYNEYIQVRDTINRARIRATAERLGYVPDYFRSVDPDSAHYWRDLTEWVWDALETPQRGVYGVDYAANWQPLPPRTSSPMFPEWPTEFVHPPSTAARSLIPLARSSWPIVVMMPTSLINTNLTT